MSVFQVASIPLFIPFFELLFNTREAGTKIFKLSEDPSMKEYLQYYLSKMIHDKSPEEALVIVIIAFFLSFLLKNIFAYLSNYLMAPVRNGFVRDFRRDVYNHLTTLPVLYFKDRKKGDILSRMTADMQEIESSIVNGFEALIKSPMIILGAIAFMMIISLKLTAFVILLLPFTVLLVGGISRKLKQQSSLAQENVSKLLTLMEETVSSIKIIKSFNATTAFTKKFSILNDFHKSILDRIMLRKSMASPLAEVMGVLVISLLMLYSGALVFKGEFMPAAFFAFIYAFALIIEPAKSFSNAYYSFQKGAAALSRVEEILNEKNNIVENANAKEKTDFNNSIEFRNVWFRYPDSDDYVLKNINFEIIKGQKIALIGMSGSGKTTMADLMSRFYDPDKGEILIDGIDIRDIRTENLRSLIGIVSQDALLFNDSILNNICFTDMPVDKEKFQFALKTAMVDEFAEDISKTDEIMIGDQGTKLSGGQKQRIAIARAIYKNAPILVLDEATSSLDSKSEKIVQKALQKVMENKTSLIITHRLSAIQKSDLVVVLQNGEIIESGTPQKLSEMKGQYYKFVQLQRL
jgi:subfamily B ATP-binding cassette protein MsbA